MYERSVIKMLRSLTVGRVVLVLAVAGVFGMAMGASTVLLGPLVTERVLAEDLKQWSSKDKLTWDDFKGEVPEDAEFDTMSWTEFRYTWKCDEKGNFTYDVRAFFDREKSWAKDEAKKSEQLLGHEQGHFDITEYFARSFRKLLANLKDPCKNIDRTKKQIEEWAKSLYADEKGTQKTYDDETKHGTDKDKQKEWDEKIQKWLDELKDYAIKDP
jgi:hypothetical protein